MKPAVLRDRHAARHPAAGLSPPALRRSRDHPGRGAAALRHLAGHRRRRADVGRGRAGLQPAPRRRWRHRRCRRRARPCRGGGAGMAPTPWRSAPCTACFPHDPARYGPYSPSSRLFLNPLYADPAATFDARRRRPRRSPGARGLDRLGRRRRREVRPPARAVRRIRTRSTRRCCASSRCFVVPRAARPCASMPASRPSRRGEAAERYHLFLQWITARSFAAAQQAAKAAGMRIGLISDLAIGMDRAGSHAWARQSDLLMGLSIGAPPDAFNPHGQDWGLTGFSPRALVATGFEPFLATLRAALAHAGGVRIDHIMGLMRLWLVPRGQPAGEGAYLAYPLEDLLRSARARIASPRRGGDRRGSRHRAAAASAARLRRAGIAGMDVLWFERTRAPLQEALALARRRGRHDHHPRPADRGRLVERRGHPHPPRAWPRYARRGPGAPAGSRAAVAGLHQCRRRRRRCRRPISRRRRRCGAGLRRPVALAADAGAAGGSAGTRRAAQSARHDR